MQQPSIKIASITNLAFEVQWLNGYWILKNCVPSSFANKLWWTGTFLTDCVALQYSLCFLRRNSAMLTLTIVPCCGFRSLSESFTALYYVSKSSHAFSLLSCSSTICQGIEPGNEASSYLLLLFSPVVSPSPPSSPLSHCMCACVYKQWISLWVTMSPSPLKSTKSLHTSGRCFVCN